MPSGSPSPWLVYALLVVIGAAGGLGDIWVYKWARAGGRGWAVAACGVWVASLLLFGLLLRLDGRTLTVLFVLSSVFHTVLVLFWDLAFFGGRLSRLEWAGVAVAALALVLLELGRGDGPTPPDEPQRAATGRLDAEGGSG